MDKLCFSCRHWEPVVCRLESKPRFYETGNCRVLSNPDEWILDFEIDCTAGEDYEVVEVHTPISFSCNLFEVARIEELRDRWNLQVQGLGAWRREERL